ANSARRPAAPRAPLPHFRSGRASRSDDWPTTGPSRGCEPRPVSRESVPCAVTSVGERNGRHGNGMQTSCRGRRGICTLWDAPFPSSSHQENSMRRWFDSFCRAVTRYAGSLTAFALAILVILIWIATGPMFHFSDTWQLVINTGTTIVTFLMVFVIQQ